MRIVRTTLAGWKRYKNHPDARVRRRYAWEARELGTTFSARRRRARSSTTATTRRCTPRCRRCCKEIARRVRLEVAAVSRRSAAATCCGKIRQEEKRLAAGWTYEPPTFYERNDACDDLGNATLLPLRDPDTSFAAPAVPLVRIGAGEPVTV